MNPKSVTKRFSTPALTAIAIIMLLLVSACSPVTQNPANNAGSNANTGALALAGPELSVQFVHFNSTDAYQQFAAAHQSSGAGLYRGGVAMGVADAPEKSAAVPTAAPAQDSTNSGGSTSPDYSQTNVQVAGIDEADTTKTDGTYIYTITGNTVFILQAYPGENASVIANLTLDSSTYPASLLVKDNTLVVMGNQYNRYGWMPRSGASYAYLYDVSDHSKPKLQQNLTFEGSYFDARLKDDYVYFVAMNYPTYGGPRPLPVMYRNGVESQIAVDRIFYNPLYNYQSPVLVTFEGIKLSDGSVQSTAVTMDGAQVMYMSPNNIYLAGSQYVNEYDIEQQVQQDVVKPYLSADDNSLIDRINAVSDDILNNYEKKSKIQQVYYDRLSQLSQSVQDNISDEVKIQTKKELAKYEYFEYTTISKFSYADGAVTPVATGKIPGSVNNQFALDEKDNVLRVGTTVHQHWSSFTDDTPIPTEANGGIGTASGVAEPSGSSSGSAVSNVAIAAPAKTVVADAKIMPPRPPTYKPTDSQNMVFTLDNKMQILGSIKDIASGEQIYATRFEGDRLYLVTYRQVDPFFVIDLSDAKNPKILGELKLPGFSRYLHPLGNDLVLGLGQDANADTGRVTGMKIALFNVTDVSNPTVVASYAGNDQYAYSTALFDHHAFLLSMEKGLLVIPVQNYVYDDMTKNYAGALVFHIDNQSIALRGLIDHASGSDIWNSQVERSLYINDLLYTKSPNLVRINQIDTLARVKDITLAPPANPDLPVY